MVSYRPKEEFPPEKPMVATFDAEYYNDPGYFHTQMKHYRDKDGNVKVWGYAKGGWDGFRTIIIPAMKSVVPDLGKLVEVGCGCGSFVDHCVRQGIDAYGVDFAKFAVEHPEGQAAGRLKQGDARKLDYPDQSFDTVVAFDLLEHIYEDDARVVVAELQRICKTWLFVNVCCQPSEEGCYSLKKGQVVPRDLEVFAVAGHVNLRSVEWWLKVWERAGLSVDWDKTEKFRKAVYPAASNWLPHYNYVIRARPG